jgi:hypothetical protein
LDGGGLSAAGHRVVHGGHRFSMTVLVGGDIIGELEEFIGRGGTLTVSGMPYDNRPIGAHVVAQASRLPGISREDAWTEEVAAVERRTCVENSVFRQVQLACREFLRPCATTSPAA